MSAVTVIARTGAPRPTYIPLGCAPSCPKH